MIPYDKRGEWKQFKDNNDLDVKFDEYMIDGINKISFCKPESILPEEKMDESVMNFEKFLKKN